MPTLPIAFGWTSPNTKILQSSCHNPKVTLIRVSTRHVASGLKPGVPPSDG